jgi:MFS family permease
VASARHDIRHRTILPSGAEDSDAPPLRAGRHLVQLVLIGCGLAIVPLDTAVNIAFPDITGSFGLPLPMIQWVVICYVLTHAGLMLAFGRVGDISSHGRVFRAGLGWSTLALLLCAAAPSYGWLLFFRFLQGIGAGLVISCAPALVTGLYPEARRSHALGVFTVIFALASAAGPLIGGALIARWGWPSVFWFRAPIALATLVLLRGLPRPVGKAGSEGFDILGAALLAFGLACLLLALNALARLGNGNFLAVPLLAGAIAGLAGFVWWEARTTRPIIRVELFRQPRFALINLANVMMYLVTFAVLLFVPYFFPRFTALPPPLAGAVLATGFIAMAAAAPPAGWLVVRLRAERVALFGAILSGAGLFLVGNWRADTAPGEMVGALALQGLGTGFFQVATMDIVMSALPSHQRGVAGSLSMLTRTIGVVTGAAALTVVFHTIEAGALGTGDTPAQAFLAAFGVTFRLAALGAMLAGAMVLWPKRPEV